MSDYRPVLTYVRSAEYQARLKNAPRQGPQPFVTISRQAGAVGRSLAEAIVNAMAGE